MALIPRVEDVDISDITNNLPSLQFESALTGEESQLLVLRKRSHALTVTACAQATYFVSILNEARQIAVQLRNPDQRRATRLLQEVTPKDPLSVGIIGCGRLGSHLANCFLTFGEVNPEDIKISTRRPETLVELQEKGVLCVNDNREVASSVHILFLCVLPSQLPTLAENIKGHIPSKCILYSFVSSLPMPRMRQLFEFTNIIRPEFEWSIESGDNPWDYTLDVTGTFAVPRMVTHTCPLFPNKDEMIIETSEKFSEQMIYAFVNMCTSLQLKRNDVMEIINAVILGDSPKTPIEVKMEERDLTRQLPDDRNLFPKFDLTAIVAKETPLTRKLITNDEVRAAYVKRYTNIFHQYLNWKNFALLQARR